MTSIANLDGFESGLIASMSRGERQAARRGRCGLAEKDGRSWQFSGFPASAVRVLRVEYTDTARAEEIDTS